MINWVIFVKNLWCNVITVTYFPVVGVQRPIRNDCCRKTNTVIGRDTAAVSRRLALGRRGGGPVNGMGAWKPVESAQSEEREPPDFQPPSM